MRRMALIGTIMTLALALGIVVPVVGALPTGIAADHSDHGHHQVPPIAKFIGELNFPHDNYSIYTIYIKRYIRMIT